MSRLKEAIPAWFRSSPQFREAEAQEQARADADRQRWAAQLEVLRKEACAVRAQREGLCTAARQAAKDAAEKAHRLCAEANQVNSQLNRVIQELETKLRSSIQVAELVEFHQWLEDQVEENRKTFKKFVVMQPPMALMGTDYGPAYWAPCGRPGEVTFDNRDDVKARNALIGAAVEEAKSLQIVFLPPDRLTERISQIRRELQQALAMKADHVGEEH